MSNPEPRKRQALRADARRNRERIIRAARESYASGGIDVPLATIARRAGVGQATLYRHFPTRAELVTAAFAEQLGHCRALLDEAVADPDPWNGFSRLVETVCAMQISDRGFTAAFLDQFPQVAGHERERNRAEAGLSRLIRRAQAAGELRSDVELSDVVLAFMANSGLAAQSPGVAAAASRRLVAFLLQSFRARHRARHRDRLPPAAPLGIGHLHLS